MRSTPEMRWVLSGCLVAMLLPISLFASFMHFIDGSWKAGSPDPFFRVGFLLIQLTIVGAIGLAVAAIVLQILRLLLVREEWEASPNSLEIRRRLLGFSWDRQYRDARLLLDPLYDRKKREPLWQLAVMSDGQKHFLIRQGALSGLGTAVFFVQRAEVVAVMALLAKYTGWSSTSTSAEAAQEAHSSTARLELPAELKTRGFRAGVDEQFRVTIQPPIQMVAGIVLLVFGGGGLYALTGVLASELHDPSTAQESLLERLIFWLMMTPMLMICVGIALVGIALLFGRERWIVGRNLLLVRSRLFGWTTERHYVDGVLTVTRLVSNAGNSLRWKLHVQSQAGEMLKMLCSEPDDDLPRLLGAVMSEHTGWPLRDGSSGESPTRSPAAP